MELAKATKIGVQPNIGAGRLWMARCEFVANPCAELKQHRPSALAPAVSRSQAAANVSAEGDPPPLPSHDEICFISKSNQA